MIKKSIFFALLLLIFYACNNNTTEKFNKIDTEENNEINVKNLYNLHCEACHGMDGAKGVSGAANLKVSKMTDLQIKNTIKNGNEKGMMPFKDVIHSEKEIDSLVVFVKSLRN
jgi:mono/diheme cytochrome c family protein